jgi:aspartate ammonia-lyase
VARNLPEGIRLLGAAVRTFSERSVEGLVFDRGICLEGSRKSVALVTFRTGLISDGGMPQIAQICQEAERTMREIRQMQGLLPESELIAFWIRCA